jgi:UDP-N-acetylglucosamine 2-epimerase (non-hydrolysing)
MLKVDMIVGVRPDFIQASALNQTFSEHTDKLNVRIIHTGEQNDPELSQIHIEQLNLQPIAAYLPVETGDSTRQLAEIIVSYDLQLKSDKPDLVLIMGNSTSALACAIVAARNGVKIAHIDAGVRYYNQALVQEQNDLMIDQLATYLFTANPESAINLIREGFDTVRILEVGNLRSDAVFMNLGFAEDSNILDRYGLNPDAYVVVYIHQEHILSDTNYLISLFTLFEELSEGAKIHVILDPQTSMLLEDTPEIILDSTDNLQFVSSHNYHDMLKLIKNATLVITDSQGVQEETTQLGVQCLTVGNEMNRPVTFSVGTNTLAGFDISEIRTNILSILSGETKEASPIDLWDGKVGQRIADFISSTDIA